MKASVVVTSLADPSDRTSSDVRSPLAGWPVCPGTWRCPPAELKLPGAPHWAPPSRPRTFPPSGCAGRGNRREDATADGLDGHRRIAVGPVEGGVGDRLAVGRLQLCGKGFRARRSGRGGRRAGLVRPVVRRAAHQQGDGSDQDSGTQGHMRRHVRSVPTAPPDKLAIGWEPGGPRRAIHHIGRVILTSPLSGRGARLGDGHVPGIRGRSVALFTVVVLAGCHDQHPEPNGYGVNASVSAAPMLNEPGALFYAPSVALRQRPGAAQAGSSPRGPDTQPAPSPDRSHGLRPQGQWTTTG